MHAVVCQGLLGAVTNSSMPMAFTRSQMLLGVIENRELLSKRQILERQLVSLLETDPQKRTPGKRALRSWLPSLSPLGGAYPREIRRRIGDGIQIRPPVSW